MNCQQSFSSTRPWCFLLALLSGAKTKESACFFILAQRHLVAGSWILCISRLNIWVAVLFLGLALIGTRLEEAWPFPDSNHCNDSSFAASRPDVFYQGVLFG